MSISNENDATALTLFLNEYLREKAKPAKPQLGRMTARNRRRQGYQQVNAKRRARLESGEPGFIIKESHDRKPGEAF